MQNAIFIMTLMIRSHLILIFLLILTAYKLTGKSIPSPPSVMLISNVTQPSCFDANDGKISITITSGLAPYTANWSSDNGFTSDQLSIINLSPGMYNIEVTDAAGDIGIISNIIVVPPSPVMVDIMTTNILCEGDKSGAIEAIATGGTSPYQFSLDGDIYQSSNSFINLSDGRYSLYTRDINGCTRQSNFVIEETSIGSIDLGPDTLAYFNQYIMMDPTFDLEGENLLIEWSGSDLSYLSCIDCLNPIIGPINKGLVYQVTVIDENGCLYKDEIRIFLYKLNFVNIPTGFTPNNDGQNDLLLVFGAKESIVKDFRVFDRFGSMIYRFTNYDINRTDIGWDGRTETGEPAMPGPYLWTVEVLYPDGELSKETGSTTLIR